MAGQIFVVVARTGAAAVQAALKEVAPENFYLIKDGDWLVSFEGTTQDLAEKLGMRDGSKGTGVVMPITNYSGRAAPDMWEWLKIHWPKDIAR